MAQFLLTDGGRELIQNIEREIEADRKRGAPDTARILIRLRKRVDPELAVAAWELVEARRRAAVKFGTLAETGYFTVEAVEQASSAAAARHHAERMAAAGMTRVLDLCGGVGADALAFARAGLTVDMYEIDPARALFARENVKIAGYADRVTVHGADAVEALGSRRASGDTEAVWFDPARRVDSRRVSDPEDYRPPLSLVETLSERGYKSVGVKLSPAVDHVLGRTYRGGLEFLSDSGECKEALLWTGMLDCETAEGGTAAAVIDAVRTSRLTSVTIDPVPATGDDPVACDTFLYEPDPAVIRAHLVQALGDRIDARVIDPHIAYLIGPVLYDTPFAKAYRVLDRFPFHLKALNRALRERSVGRVVIKKRGFPQEPEQVRKQLKLQGDQEITIVLTRVGVQHQAILCRPV